MAKQPTPPFNAPEVPFAHKPPAITILSDHPSHDRSLENLFLDDVAWVADQDRLTLESRLASTFDILRHKNTRCPLTVAVYGDWGTGKTSAMRWLQTRLQEWNKLENKERGGHPRAYPVWFDPWRYHSREEVWRGIIAEVILALFSVGNLDRQNFVPRMVQAAKKFGGFLGRGFLHALSNIEVTIGKAEAGGEAKLSGDAFREIWEEYEKAAKPHEAYLNQFEETLRHWVASFLGPQSSGEDKPNGIAHEPARLVLFIDDLDRCLPEVTLEVIEALKLYLNIDHLIFVVGLDQTVVSAVVTKHYKDHGVTEDKAQRYLDKVFQVDLRIPPSEAQMPDYMKAQIEALNKATNNYWHKIMERSGYRAPLENTLILLARNNPREVKRLLNSALLRGRAASLNSKLTPEIEGPIGKETPNEARIRRERDEALRFAQGVQVFLLHRMLSQQIANCDELIILGRHLAWFEGSSWTIRKVLEDGEVSAGSLAHLWRSINLEAESVHSTATPPIRIFPKTTSGKPFTKQREDFCLSAYRSITSNTPQPNNMLWLSDEFVELMQVPFSKAVAESFPPPPAPTSRANVGTLSISSLPDWLRERLAKAAKVPLTDFQASDIPKIRSLDLNDTPIDQGLLGSLLPHLELDSLALGGASKLIALPDIQSMTTLRRLRLSKCTGLTKAEDLGGLELLQGLEWLSLSQSTNLIALPDLKEMNNLQTLYLTGCSGLQGIASLGGVTSLRNLKVLELKGCTGLGPMVVAQVKEQMGEWCNVVG